MSPEHRNIELMVRFFDEVWSQGRAETIDELYAVGGVAHGLGEEYKNGPEEFKQLHSLLHSTCSNVRAEIGDIMAAGDRVALRARVSMIHQGKEVSFEGGGFARIEDGRIVEAWNGWDILGFLVQLDAVPADILPNALTGVGSPQR